jgi:hypothetical protein
MKFHVQRIVMPLTCTMLLCSFVGCATFHIPFEKKIPKASATDPVVQVLCLWQQAEGRDPEGYPCKGFSGQILFLSSKAATPVQCEGDVRIYLFDDQGNAEAQAKPLRQFDFDAGSWDIHLTETSLGPTYSVFVPYVRRGVKDANCALRVRLKPKNGPVVFSDLSNMPLNGNKKPVMGENAKPITIEETDRMAADEMAGKLRRTTTISMGSNPKTTESVAVAKKDEKFNQIQLASHEVVSEAPRETADAERIRRLESMVQQLLEQKSNTPTIPVSSSQPILSLDRLGLNRPQVIDSPPAGRVKWNPRPARSSGDDEASENDENEAEEAAPSLRRKHPLED